MKNILICFSLFLAITSVCVASAPVTDDEMDELAHLRSLATGRVVLFLGKPTREQYDTDVEKYRQMIKIKGLGGDAPACVFHMSQLTQKPSKLPTSISVGGSVHKNRFRATAFCRGAHIWGVLANV